MVRQADLALELCPACGLRPQVDDRTGFCAECTTGRLLERYHARDAAEISERREAWRRRSGIDASKAPAATRERQRRSRLLRRTRPRELPHAGADPLELASEALDRLARLRPIAQRADVTARYRLIEDLDAVEELVRQLAWGPEA